MRVTITTLGQPELRLSMRDDSPANRPDSPIGPMVWLDRHPLDGWYDGVDLKTQAADNPAGDGLYMPARLLMAERVVTIKGHQTRNPHDEGSSIGDMRLRDLLRALVGQPVTLSVADTMGVREATGYVSSKIISGDENENYGLLRFAIILTCPDPLVYSNPVTYQASGSRIMAENNGTAASWPVLAVSGSPKRIVASLDGRRVDWRFDDRPVQAAELDFATMIPTIGTVSNDDGFQIPPGRHTISVTVQGSADVALRVRNAWR
ncbi:hypothetical protein [Bifidobacterium scardovii]|uniref:Uncharacterized protein n=1 Tax=Bifidobacterium scardovii TaxID=158787 RepID=A0A087DGM5_9BIFI|nr:hypothetical protein [Bifidobacterium scardovii]DAE55495.1 MAG TPA: tail protein [Caudoviricetes sp.]KFI94675.1 hypothetical protein BSCA_0727 [Bifidobacterium scardovii]MDK6349813.1 hypothetical protein [Bifidobacterium scardovii]MDU8982517.1 hypothetical protein [Bifidobacterium scardovii]BAQ32093.1 hypothetical phage protein [Bifidobacterium scardovii JCM 12489 = DSM 13734]